MKGSFCKCGYKTISQKDACPSCGRLMEKCEFSDSGRVLALIKSDMIPEKHATPMHLVMVGITEGPMIICWTNSNISKDQIVKVSHQDGLMRCDSL